MTTKWKQLVKNEIQKAEPQDRPADLFAAAGEGAEHSTGTTSRVLDTKRDKGLQVLLKALQRGEKPCREEKQLAEAVEAALNTAFQENWEGYTAMV